MRSVYVLYIEDSTVGPYLELLRNVCQPTSKARPHITVRYFAKLSVPDEYENIEVTHLDLTAPGGFGVENPTPHEPSVVYIGCECEELLPLEHKPHFPTSEFHVTLYEGRSRKFAQALLDLLRRYRWSVRVALPPGSKLQAVRLGSRRVRVGSPPNALSERVVALLEERLGIPADRDYLAGLDDATRLDLVRAICDDFEAAAADLESVRATRRIDVSMPPKRLAEADVHLTPPELARDIAEFAIRLVDPTSLIRFGDPAVGTGAFFAAVRRVVTNGRLRDAIGVDISPSQVAAARKRWEQRGMKVMPGDYLHMERLPGRNLILANPPYLRHQRVPSKYKHELRERASLVLGRTVSARAGLYVYFILLSHKWMSPGAVAAWLIPAEFMQTDYGSAIREYLVTMVRLERIHIYGANDPQFENAMVLPAVVVFRNETAESNHDVQVSVGGTLDNPDWEEVVSVESLAERSRWSFPSPNALGLPAEDVRLGDLFDVTRGIATGANQFFILERSQARDLGIPEWAVRPILPQARSLEKDEVDATQDGWPRTKPELCVIDVDVSPDELRRRAPRLWAYLLSGQALGIRNRTLVQRRTPWYKQEHRKPAPFLCTYMGRGSKGGPPLRFIWNHSDAIATNSYLMLYPKPWLAIALKDASKARELFLVLKQVERRTMAFEWRQHAGGLRKIEPGDLPQVPLPVVPEWILECGDIPLRLRL